MKLAQQNPEAFKAQMEAMMSQLAGGPEQGRALMEAAKGLWDGSADPAQLEALSKLPGMEALADPEAMKRQMAELQKMMGAGQVPAMGARPETLVPSRRPLPDSTPIHADAAGPAARRRVGRRGPARRAAGASGCTLFEEPRARCPQIQNSDMARTVRP